MNCDGTPPLSMKALMTFLSAGFYIITTIILQFLASISFLMALVYRSGLNPGTSTH